VSHRWRCPSIQAESGPSTCSGKGLQGRDSFLASPGDKTRSPGSTSGTKLLVAPPCRLVEKYARPPRRTRAPAADQLLRPAGDWAPMSRGATKMEIKALLRGPWPRVVARPAGRSGWKIQWVLNHGPGARDGSQPTHKLEQIEAFG